LYIFGESIFAYSPFFSHFFQVGCVGDSGYRRQGYLMQHFHVLIERLQAIYGTEYKITNYIASQLPSVKPTIQIISLQSLLDPDFVKKNITAVSTFYVAPKDTRKTDPEMARKLGLLSLVKPEIQQQADCQAHKSKSKSARLRDISKYGSREQNSLKMLSTWKIPGAYDPTAHTAAADFMISLAQDPKKISEFQENPGKLSNEATGILPWQTKYLSSGNRAMVRLAVKPNSNNAARAAAIELLTSNSFCKSYADEMKKYVHDPDLDTKLTAFLELHGFKTTPDAVQNALQELRESSLLPWRQVYHTSVGILEIRCKNANDKGHVIWKDAPIQNFTFSSSTLTWDADTVNQSSAVLKFTTEDGLPLFTGKLWDKNQPQPASQNINGAIENFKSPLSVWRGNYRTTTLAKGSKRQGIPGLEMAITFSKTNPVGTVECGGKPVADFKFKNKTLSWAYGEITFFASKATVSEPSVEKFYGYIWNEGEGKPAGYNFWGTKDTTFLQPWSGKYETFIGPEGKAKEGGELIINGGVNIASSAIQYERKNIKNFQFNNPVLSWQDDGKNVEIRFEVFKNKKLGFLGKMWSTNDSKPSNNNFEGLFDSIYLDAWLGCYYTKNGAGPGKTTNGQPFSIVKQENDYLITYNGNLIKNYHYDSAKRNLQWSTSGNNSNGSLQFYIPPPDKETGLHFFGKVWANGQPTPNATNFWGSTVPFPGAGSSGNGEQQLVQLVENLVTIALIELLKYAWKKFKKWWKSKRDGSSKEEEDKLKKESEEADDKAENQEEKVNDQEAKTDELDPEVDPSPEPPIPPDPAPEPPSNAVETDTDTTDTDTTETDTDTDVDTDVDVDTDIDIVVDICSLM
jgi:hypothetical protein